MLPQDPFLLLSVVNTKLRDEYDSFGELCAALDESPDELGARLAAVGYQYDPAGNQMIRKENV